MSRCWWMVVFWPYLIYSGTCLIWHTKEPGKCIGLYRMPEYSGFILVNRITLGQSIFVRCHRMSENSGVGLHKFHCISLFSCGNLNFLPMSYHSAILISNLSRFNCSCVLTGQSPSGKLSGMVTLNLKTPSW